MGGPIRWFSRNDAPRWGAGTAAGAGCFRSRANERSLQTSTRCWAQGKQRSALVPSVYRVREGASADSLDWYRARRIERNGVGYLAVASTWESTRGTH